MTAADPAAGATRSGGCLCGAVRYTLTGAASHFDACHCSMCRRFSGGVFLGIEAPPHGLGWQGEEMISTYSSSDWAERGFCRRCGSALFWRMTDGSHTIIALGSLDSFEGLTFSTEVFVDEQPAAYAFAGERRRMTGAEVVAAFQGDDA